MRAICLLATLVAASACGRRTPATPTAPAPATLDATVVGPEGPVPGALVRMLTLPAAPCPCTQSGLDANAGYGNEMPECACPEALAQWRSRLERCGTADEVVAELRTDPHGRVRLDPSRGVTSLEAIGAPGLLWMPWPSARAPISLPLEDPIQPTIQIAGASPDAIRGAVLFDDGHCVPIERTGDAWTTRTPVPRFEASGGTLIIEATGFATTIYSLFDQDRIDIELVPATPLTGTCDGAFVRFDNPFQHLVVKVDDTKQFAINGALAMGGRVGCWKDAQTLVEEWDSLPGHPLTERSMSVNWGGTCTDVRVVDTDNRPVADANVSVMSDHGGGHSSGFSVSTNAAGITCVGDLPVPGSLEVTAPDGPCAGTTTVSLTQQHLAQTPIIVRLRRTPLRGTALRGRVLASDGSPVVGATVTVKELLPTNPADCTPTIAASSGLDGTFSLAPVPPGKVVLETDHKWFAPRQVTVAHDGSMHDVVLPRGERWTGRLLDPEGTPINDCFMSLRLSDGRTLYASCRDGAFVIMPLVPGEARLQVRIGNHALGTARSLIRTVQLASGARRDDIQFPRGEHIRGRVLDKAGNAIPRAQLTALPKGTVEPHDRLHDDEVQVEADELGRFTFRHLTPGTWTLHGIGRTHTQTSLDVATGTADAVLVVPAI